MTESELQEIIYNAIWFPTTHSGDFIAKLLDASWCCNSEYEDSFWKRLQEELKMKGLDTQLASLNNKDGEIIG